MRALGVAVLAIAACQAHNPALERQVDTLSAQLAAMQRDVAVIREAVQAPPPPSPELQRKLDELQAKLDRLAERPVAPPAPARRGPDPDKTYAIKVAGFPAEGPVTAKVTLVTAFDYACPYCERSRQTRADLRKKYGNDLRIVYRNFVVHPQVATATAVGGCAAHEQHEFFAYDTLAWEQGFKAHSFDQDKCWETPAGCPVVEGFAREAKLDIARFKRDMKGCAAIVGADVSDLQRFGVGATPTFFVNGRFLEGAMPIEDFSRVIDEELAKANERIAAGARAATYYDEFVIGQGLPSAP